MCLYKFILLIGIQILLSCNNYYNTTERVEGKLYRIQEKGGEVCQKKPRGVFVGDEQIFKWKDLFNSGKLYRNKPISCLHFDNSFWYIYVGKP